jgi:hypothetical protein
MIQLKPLNLRLNIEALHFPDLKPDPTSSYTPIRSATAVVYVRGSPQKKKLTTDEMTRICECLAEYLPAP